MKRLILAAGIVGLATGGSLAQSAQRIALDLGTVIGSERACGLTFDQAAIAAFIEKKVAATDMEFMTTMNNSASMAEIDVKEFSASQRTAHCTQIARVAKSNGFIK
jgi:hypothetical protein